MGIMKGIKKRKKTKKMMARFGLLIVWDFDGMPCWNCFEN